MNLSKYQTLSEICQNSWHVVHRVVDSLGSKFLLKTPRSGSLNEFASAKLRREYETLKDLETTGIPRYLEIQSTPSGIALLMEDIEGTSLSDQLKKPLAIADGLNVGLQLTKVLSKLHRLQIIHGNVCLHSILVDETLDRVFLVNHSLPSVSEQNDQFISSHILLKDLIYMAPEQTGRINRTADYRADFYALGVTLYEIFTGRPPFTADDTLDLIHSHIARQPKPLSEIRHDVPLVVSNLVMRLLAKNADERYQSAIGIQADLERCLEEFASHGSIKSFELASNDISDRFVIPQTLFGRDQELETLGEGFEHACNGSTVMSLVTGPPGIGKTSLIHELWKPIVRQHGYLGSGKCDQVLREVPFGVLLQALRTVAQQIITESEDRITHWRDTFLDYLGPNAGLITQVIPEIESIIGKQIAPSLLAPTEAQNRFQLVFQQFMRCIARREHPLVLILDDLQWADAASLNVLQPLLTTPDIKYFYVVGTYRETEVDEKHRLSQVLGKIESAGGIIRPLLLNPLNLNHVTEVVWGIVHGDREAAKSLARIVLNKTAGNPFFITEFMRHLHDEGMLQFDYDSRRWSFNLERIVEADVTENVINLMARKIEKLSSRTQETLKCAALLGNTFQMEVLALAKEQSVEVTRHDLSEAVREGLIIASSSGYTPPVEFSTMELQPNAFRFVHDQLHQASYGLIDHVHLPSLHLSIGRLMLNRWGKDAEEARLFEIVHQLNLGSQLISSDQERLDLAELNLRAGRTAKRSTAFQSALNYTNLSRKLLTDGDWINHYDLTFDVNLEAAECSYLCGDFVSAEELLTVLLKRASTTLDAARAHNLRIVEYENLTRYDDALQSGRQALALFGISLADSAQKKQAALEIEMESIKALLGERSIESLIDSKTINDPEIRMVINLLTNIWPSAYLTGDVILTSLISAIIVRLSLIYGHCEESAYGYVTHAITVGPIRGDYKSAYDFGKLALRVNERFNDTKRKAKIYQQFQAHVNLWRRPLETCIPYAREASRIGLETGDFTYANYGAFTESWSAFLTTNNFSQFVADYAQNLEFIKKLKFTNFADAQQLILNWAGALCAETNHPWSLTSESFDESAYEQNYRGNPFFMNFYHLANLQLRFHFGRYEEALDSAANAEWIVQPLLGTVWPPLWTFWRGLILAINGDRMKADQKTAILEELEKLQEQLSRLADNCPENFRCYWLLLSAEIERVAGRSLPAFDLYEEAISFARKTNHLQQLALANERCASFWLDREQTTVAAAFLQEAVESYATLGASAKVRHLQASYGPILADKLPPLVATRITAEQSLDKRGDPDFATALKAALAIAGEMDLNRLLEQLMSIVIENAGAEKGYLLLEKDGEAWIQSEGDVENIQVTVGTASPLDKATTLSKSIVNYVRRTGESVVLNDAATDERFAADTYVQEYQPRAVMCIPIVKQGQLVGTMYLENNLTTNAFTPDRIQLVQLLASEAAISLENARLYEEMKEEVRQRKLAEETLRSITAGTANVTGADFFYSLVRHLASALRVRYTFVTKCVGDDKSSVRTLAFWNGETFAENIEYDLEPTPCRKVIAGAACHYPTSLQELFPEDQILVDLNAQSFFGVPLVNSTGEVIGHLVALDDQPMTENPSEHPILRIFAARAGAELERLRADEELKSALAEVEALKNRLQAENIYLQEELNQEHPFEEIVGNSPPLLRMLAEVERIAATSATVLIVGETGTGKELLARAIHNGSSRRERALVKVNCGAISAGLVESELFGHVKGAFTGAISNRVGRFELADGGTLFLDEISELPMDTQVKLLRVLQEGEFEPVGSSRTIHVDVRIIAASNRNLEEEIKVGRFRPDLFYRLNVLPLNVPSLQERASDIPQLVMFFLSKFAKKFGKTIQSVTQDTMRRLVAYSWPGNIRELQNVIERAVVLSEGTHLHLGDELFSGSQVNEEKVLAQAAGQSSNTRVRESREVKTSLQEVERDHILGVLEQVNWVIEGPRGAARILNLHPNTLRSRMKKLSIRRASHDIS